MKRAKFELWQIRAGSWYWHLKAANGEIIAQSEGYETEQGARKGIAAVRRLALFAQVKQK